PAHAAGRELAPPARRPHPRGPRGRGGPSPGRRAGTHGRGRRGRGAGGLGRGRHEWGRGDQKRSNCSEPGKAAHRRPLEKAAAAGQKLHLAAPQLLHRQVKVGRRRRSQTLNGSPTEGRADGGPSRRGGQRAANRKTRRRPAQPWTRKGEGERLKNSTVSDLLRPLLAPRRAGLGGRGRRSPQSLLHGLYCALHQQAKGLLGAQDHGVSVLFSPLY
ncbi:PREDICTED: uncharacterized protein LOC106147679, partial [Chinchilla lanigera]|uniref:uncharacterized protein LOC106147679 n=1 Tax=Chinchilla lanigera TaxID=34839 RepID=UPI0006978A5B